MNRRNFYISVIGVIFVIALISVGKFMQYRKDPQHLLANFNSQLKAGRFEEMYDDAAENVPLNVSKEVFVARMKETAAKLRAVDEDLNFQYDPEYGQEIGAGDLSMIHTINCFQTLSKDGKSVSMDIYWNTSYLAPKLFDFIVIPRNEISQPYESPGVAYKTIVKR